MNANKAAIRYLKEPDPVNARPASVASVRLCAPAPFQPGDLEAGPSAIVGNSSIFGRRARAGSRGTIINNETDITIASNEIARSQEKTVVGATKQLFSKAIATATGVHDPVTLATDPEAIEKQKIIDERTKYDQQVVDLLDVIDPEVSTLSTLGDLQNSLFIPNLGTFVNRTQYLNLTKPDPREVDVSSPLSTSGHAPSLASNESFTDPPSLRTWLFKSKEKKSITLPQTASQAQEQRLNTVHEEPQEASKAEPVARGKYLILPDGLVDWNKWSSEEREELDDYVRHLLHSKKWKLRRTWRGFKQYVSTPLGAFVTIYASLLTFWGAAWVLFIIGWIPSGGREEYFQEVCDQILTALFCLVGIGLAPWRVVDTYHMIFIAKYHRKTLRLYRESGEPALPDENDLPDPLRRQMTGRTVEEKEQQQNIIRNPVLTIEEQATFLYHQKKFAKSHTFYRPHETETHKAFPHDLLVVVVCLLDCHSLFQIALGSTTWSISYHQAFKHTLTAVILSFSICCNVSAGLVITVGNRRTRKTQVLEERLRQAVTEEAVQRKKAKEEVKLKEEAERRNHNGKAHSKDKSSSLHETTEMRDAVKDAEEASRQP